VRDGVAQPALATRQAYPSSNSTRERSGGGAVPPWMSRSIMPCSASLNTVWCQRSKRGVEPGEESKTRRSSAPLSTEIGPAACVSGRESSNDLVRDKASGA
jgi:hypothetical protein